MNKSNVFCSSPFYAGIGDIIHILVLDDTGTPIHIELSGDDDNTAPSAPIATAATDIVNTSFTSNWLYNENTTGYEVDVALDYDFTLIVINSQDAGYAISDSMTGLVQGTNYYYRVRAYNSYGTSPNSNTISLSTTTTTALKDLDGNIYTTITIGSQEWIVENLKVTQYADAEPIPLITDDTAWIGNVTKDVYGALYNWYAVDTGKLAPAGWHVWTRFESADIMLYLDATGDGGMNIAGNNMRETGVSYWDAPNSNANNSSGFNGRGTGYRNYDGTFQDVHTSSFYQHPEIYGSGENYACILLANDNTFYVTSGANSTAASMTQGLSVRLVKDSTLLANGESGVMTDIDGNVYPTICINGKEIMAVNLKVTHYNDSTDIPLITDNTLWAADTAGAMCYYGNDTGTLTDAYCWYDNDSATNKTPYGALYNKLAVNSVHELAYLERGGVQELGWRVPTYADFIALSNYLATNIGGKLKETGFVYWETPNYNATNETGFYGRGSGVRDSTTGDFIELKTIGAFYVKGGWDISMTNFLMSLSSADEILATSVPPDAFGASVRLIRTPPAMGLTVDTTVVTVDNGLITSDNQS